MNQFRIVFTTLFLVGLLLLLFQYLLINVFYGIPFRAGSIQLKDASQGFALASAWANTPAGSHTLLYYAKQNTWLDFIWIVGYAGVLINLAYTAMQKEKSILLNELLRSCFLLTLLAGVLDVIENSFLLFDFTHLESADKFFSSAYYSYPKWILVGFVIFILIVSFVKRNLSKGRF